MTNKIMNIGFIGNGKSVNRYHVPYILNRKETMQIKMIYSRNHAKDAWNEIPNVVYTSNLDELLNNDELDVIIVNTPVAFHYMYAKKVIEAKKNCVVEKPFTNTYEEAKELFELAQKNGVLLESYQNRRFDSDFLTVKKVIESGKLGDLIEIESHCDYYRPQHPLSIQNYSVDSSYLYNLGAHTLDQIISYFGKPDNVHYDVRQLLGENRMNDYFDIDMYYGTLKVSLQGSYFRVKPRAKFIVYGMKGMFIKESEDRQEEHLKLFYMPDNPGFGEDRPQDYGTLIYYDEKGYHEEKVVSEFGDYALFYDALYESIINNKEPLVKKEETLLLMKMLEQGVSNLK